MRQRGEMAGVLEYQYTVNWYFLYELKRLEGRWSWLVIVCSSLTTVLALLELEDAKDLSYYLRGVASGCSMLTTLMAAWLKKSNYVERIKNADRYIQSVKKVSTEVYAQLARPYAGPAIIQHLYREVRPADHGHPLRGTPDVTGGVEALRLDPDQVLPRASARHLSLVQEGARRRLCRDELGTRHPQDLRGRVLLLRLAAAHRRLLLHVSVLQGLNRNDRGDVCREGRSASTSARVRVT